MQFKETFIRNR